jgi:hypothetical protein
MKKLVLEIGSAADQALRDYLRAATEYRRLVQRMSAAIGVTTKAEYDDLRESVTIARITCQRLRAALGTAHESRSACKLL